MSNSTWPPSVVCQILPIDSSALAHYSTTLSAHGIQAPLEALARAVATSPDWSHEAAPVIVVRLSPSPRLAVVGEFDEAGSAWLQAQARALSTACGSLRYAGYWQVQRECETLADLLLSRLGNAKLGGCRFVAIPRGGLIVLGLLAAALGLRHEQLTPPYEDPGETLVVVDDCAISGLRFARFLESCPHHRVIFACLYSPPGLRSALQAFEPRIVACLSAADLAGKEMTPTATSTFPESGGSQRFWHGSPEALGLPWNEPDRLVWNPKHKHYDLAWRIVPPELCLKNRSAPGAAPVQIQVQPEPKGPLRPTEQALFAEIGGEVALCDLREERILRLGGVGSDLWRAILLHGTVEGAVEALRDLYDARPETLFADARRFVDDLVSRGLLELSSE